MNPPPTQACPNLHVWGKGAIGGVGLVGPKLIVHYDLFGWGNWRDIDKSRKGAGRPHKALGPLRLSAPVCRLFRLRPYLV